VRAYACACACVRVFILVLLFIFAFLKTIKPHYTTQCVLFSSCTWTDYYCI